MPIAIVRLDASAHMAHLCQHPMSPKGCTLLPTNARRISFPCVCSVPLACGRLLVAPRALTAPLRLRSQIVMSCHLQNSEQVSSAPHSGGLRRNLAATQQVAVRGVAPLVHPLGPWTASNLASEG